MRGSRRSHLVQVGIVLLALINSGCTAFNVQFLDGVLLGKSLERKAEDQSLTLI